MNANDLKDQGNMYFAARRFNDAVACYTKAIVSMVLPNSIALCYMYREGSESTLSTQCWLIPFQIVNFFILFLKKNLRDGWRLGD